MNIIETIVDKTFIINLKHRVDRRDHATKELQGIGWEHFEFFEAYCPQSPTIPQIYIDKTNKRPFEMNRFHGVNFSHYAVIEKAAEQNLNAVMIFEDDVMIQSNFNEVTDKAIKQLEGVEWDCLHFGGNHLYFTSTEEGNNYGMTGDGLEPTKGNLARIKRMYNSHALLFKKSVFPFILDNFLQSGRIIDNFYAYELYRRFNCYCIRPGVAFQYPNMSDLQNRFEDVLKYMD